MCPFSIDSTSKYEEHINEVHDSLMVRLREITYKENVYTTYIYIAKVTSVWNGLSLAQ